MASPLGGCSPHTHLMHPPATLPPALPNTCACRHTRTHIHTTATAAHRFGSAARRLCLGRTTRSGSWPWWPRAAGPSTPAVRQHVHSKRQYGDGLGRPTVRCISLAALDGPGGDTYPPAPPPGCPPTPPPLHLLTFSSPPIRSSSVPCTPHTGTLVAFACACVGLKSGKARTSLQHRLPAETGREPGESRESNKSGVEQGDMQRKQLTGHASKRVYDWQSGMAHWGETQRYGSMGWPNGSAER